MVGMVPNKDELPDFTCFNPAVFLESLQALMDQHQACLLACLACDGGWKNQLAPLVAAEHELSQAWSLIAHQQSVCNQDQTRDIFAQATQLVTQFYTRLLHDQRYYQLLQAVLVGYGSCLNHVQRAYVEHSIRDARLAGVHLGADDQAMLAACQQTISEAERRFDEQLLDAEGAWQAEVSVGALAGLPEHCLVQATQGAKAGQARLTLEPSLVAAVLGYVNDAGVRQQVYHAFVTRASDQGPHAGRWDNAPIIAQVLQVRHAMATRLGFKHFAAYALATRMAKTTEDVEDFLQGLIARVRPKAQAEWQELCDFARCELGLNTLNAWDVRYASECLQRQRFDLDQESLRRYFPLSCVMAGFERLLDALFGCRLEPVQASVWHPDVRCYALMREEQVLGYAYTDYFSRPGQKRSGAWIAEGRSRAEQTLPVVWVHANFQPPCHGQEAHLTHEDVETLFHEWGHALHHVLTWVEVPGVAGLNGVPWDAVEWPSQWLEQWCWHPMVLDWVSGGCLPKDVSQLLQQSRSFQSGMRLLRQLAYAWFDWTLHARDNTTVCEADVLRCWEQVHRDVSGWMPRVDDDRFPCGFTHLFSGGYAAGYYSYLWAECLASDTLLAFEEAGWFSRACAQRFEECVLGQGGSVDMMRAFEAFRGREPDLGALLKLRGLGAL